MTIFEQLNEMLAKHSKLRLEPVFSAAEIDELMFAEYQTNKESINPSDYCYNRTNNGPRFDPSTRILQLISRGQYKYLGKGYKYSGNVSHMEKGSKEEKVVGNWLEGEYTPYDRTKKFSAENIEELNGMGKESDNEVSIPLNQILFGAAGTGKTYHTVNEALRIIDPAFLKKFETDRVKLKERFDHFMNESRIRFVTFHQSFSYEDFVEGIRAINNDDTGQLTYKVEDGIFKEICNDAIRHRQTEKVLGLNDSPRIWKISIGHNSSRAYCFQNGEARIGWSYTGDLQLEDSYQSDYFKSLGSNDRHTLISFAQDMQAGDIVVCLKTASEISAVGVVGDYFYDAKPPSEVRGDYCHCRKVNWLLKDINFNIKKINGNKNLTLKTVFELKRFSWIELELALEQENLVLPQTAHVNDEKLPYVLIIDEINRGNISRIFGELITLIEESKRQGEEEGLKVDLPYSKKPFSVPNNVYIIGTMNSSDRSLTGLDIALRRRFTFIEMQPKPEVLKDRTVEGINIEKLLQIMNQRIEVLLDRDHCIGHAYFIPLTNDSSLSQLAHIFKQKIMPLLQEYFYDDWERIDWVFNQNGFITKTNTDLDRLFKSGIASKLQSHCWKVNDDAFNSQRNYQIIMNMSSDNEVNDDETGDTE